MKSKVIGIVLIFSLISNIVFAFSPPLADENIYDVDSLTEIADVASPTDLIAYFTCGDEFCIGDTVLFNNESTGDYTNIHWNFGDGFDTRTWGSPFHIYDTAGIFTVTLKVTMILEGTGYSRTDSMQKTVEILPSPTIEFMYNPEDTMIYRNKRQKINAAGDFSQIEWEFWPYDLPVEKLGNTSEEIEVNREGWYRAIATGDNGCSTSKMTSFIEVLGDYPAETDYQIVIINNIITPNGDNINDYLLVEDIDKYDAPIEMAIYNVWGDKVFETSDYRNEVWDGSEVDSGTYFYHVLSVGKQGKTGYVDVLK